MVRTLIDTRMPRQRSKSALAPKTTVFNENFEHPMPTFVCRTWKSMVPETAKDAQALKLQALVRGWAVRRFVEKLHAKADARAYRLAQERHAIEDMVGPGDYILAMERDEEVPLSKEHWTLLFALTAP